MLRIGGYDTKVGILRILGCEVGRDRTVKRIHSGPQSKLYPQEHVLSGLAAVGGKLVEEIRAGWYKVLQAVLRDFGGRVAKGYAELRPFDLRNLKQEEKEESKEESKEEGEKDDKGSDPVSVSRDASALCKIALWACTFRQNDIAFLNDCRIVDTLHDIIGGSKDANVCMLAWNLLKMIVLTGAYTLRDVFNSRLQKHIHDLIGDAFDVFGAIVDENLILMNQQTFNQGSDLRVSDI